LLSDLEKFAADIRERIEEIRDEEQEYLDHMPDAFADGCKGEAANDVIEALDEAMEVLQSIEDETGVAVELLEAAGA